jgi:hypothetical protein
MLTASIKYHALTPASFNSFCKRLISACSAVRAGFSPAATLPYWICLHLLILPESIPNSAAAVFTDPLA